MFEYLVPQLKGCLGRIKKSGPSGRGMSLQADFEVSKGLPLFPISLSAFLLPDKDVSSHLFLLPYPYSIHHQRL